MRHWAAACFRCGGTLRLVCTCALGTDVGGGTGFGMLKEGLQAYLLQRLAPDGVLLTPAHLLYLATRAGAEALGLDEEIGDFSPGKAADFVYLRPPEGSPLAAVIGAGPSMGSNSCGAVHAGGAESVREVCVEGAAVYRSDQHDHLSRAERSGSCGSL